MPPNQKNRLIMEAIYYMSIEYRRLPGNSNKAFESIIEFLGPEDEEEDYNEEDEILIQPINTSCEDSLRQEFNFKTKPSRFRQLIDGAEQIFFLEDNKNFHMITEHPRLANMLSTVKTEEQKK